MRRLLAPVILLAALLTLGLAGASACNKSVKPSDANQVIAFGDSLVFGVGTTSGNNFVSLLSQRLNISIINAGRPGDTTADALSGSRAPCSTAPPACHRPLEGMTIAERPASSAHQQHHHHRLSIRAAARR